MKTYAELHLPEYLACLKISGAAVTERIQKHTSCLVYIIYSKNVDFVNNFKKHRTARHAINYMAPYTFNLYAMLLRQSTYYNST